MRRASTGLVYTNPVESLVRQFPGPLHRSLRSVCRHSDWGLLPFDELSLQAGLVVDTARP